MSNIEYTPTAQDISNLRAVFHGLWEKLPKAEYSPKWANGTGYFDGLAVEEPGPAFASTDPSGRKIVYLGSMLSDETALVLFERYSNGDKGPIMLHAPRYYLQGDDNKIPSAGMAKEAIPYLAPILSAQLKALS